MLRTPIKLLLCSQDGDRMEWENWEARIAPFLLLFHNQGARPLNSRIPLDPRWALPIKTRVRQHVQAKAVNEVVNALNPSLGSAPSNVKAPLRVVNGMSTPSASTVTAATAGTSVAPGSSINSPVDGLPRNSAMWGMGGGGLVTHVEHEDESGLTGDGRQMPDVMHVERAPRVINPSLETLEKAAAAKIYFENLYFPLFRHPPSREQRRIAMEKEMEDLGLSDSRKDNLRARWRQNETDYLRERRRKVDVSAFVKLKTIGHGMSTRAAVLQVPQ